MSHILARFEKGDTDLTLDGKSIRHTVRRAHGMGEMVVVIFRKHSLPHCGRRHHSDIVSDNSIV